MLCCPTGNLSQKAVKREILHSLDAFDVLLHRATAIVAQRQLLSTYRRQQAEQPT